MEHQSIINSEDTEIVYVESWKGKDEISIYEGPKYYKIIEHRKNKEDGQVDESATTILKDDVKFIWDDIILNCEMGEKYGYRFLVRKLIEAGKVDFSEIVPSFKVFDEKIRKSYPELKENYINFLAEIAMETFNGGKFRKGAYFPYYYYPLKVLEAKGYVQYFGRGGIARLMEGEFR